MLATDHRTHAGLCLQKESGRANRTLWELGRAVPGVIPVAHWAGVTTLSDRSLICRIEQDKAATRVEN